MGKVVKIGNVSADAESTEYRAMIAGMRRFLANAPIDWYTNWGLALEAANQAMKYGGADAGVIMADFSGSNWCQPCQNLEKEVFESDTFRLWFNQRRMVPMLVDFPMNTPQDPQTKQQNAQLQLQYQAFSYPTVIAIKADGSEIGRLEGYNQGMGADAWINAFKQVSGISYTAAHK
jgi:thiol:disulfide interchange protein